MKALKSLINGLLRHYYAGRFAPVIWKQFNEDGTSRKFPEWKEGVAVESYRMADLMIERSKIK